MTRDRSQLVRWAGRLAAIGASIGVVAGGIQAAVGRRIPEWSGNKHEPLALGLLTIALGVSGLVAARILRAPSAPDDETLTAITLWLALVAVVCSITVGRLWAVPGALLLAAAGVTVVACGGRRFRAVVASHWLRGVLGVLGAFELLVAAGAASALTIAAGLVAGGALVAAAISTGPGRQPIVVILVAATVPFMAITWWTIVTPVLTVVALAIGLATAGRDDRSVGVAIDGQPAP